MSAIARIMPCPRSRSAARVAADLRADFVAEAADRASYFARRGAGSTARRHADGRRAARSGAHVRQRGDRSHQRGHAIMRISERGFEQNFPVHPATNAYRMMDDDELEGLVESIAEIGLIDPITVGVLNGERFIVDGRCRPKACEIAGVEPRFGAFLGDGTPRGLT